MSRHEILSIEDVKQRLIDRIDKEYDEFEKNEKTKTVSEVYDDAYKISSYNDLETTFKYLIENFDEYDMGKAEALYESKYGLMSSGWNAWIDWDANGFEEMEYCIRAFIEDMEKEYKAEQEG